MQRPEWQDALDLIATALISRSEANTRFAQVCGAVMAKGWKIPLSTVAHVW